ncbi:hypothetical protein AAC387_Pa07g1269 [Persea americana]
MKKKTTRARAIMSSSSGMNSLTRLGAIGKISFFSSLPKWTIICTASYAMRGFALRRNYALLEENLEEVTAVSFFQNFCLGHMMA